METTQSQSFPGPITLIKQAYATYRAIYKVIIPVLLISFLASSFQVIVAFSSGSNSFTYFFGTVLSFILVSLSYLAVVIAITTPAPDNVFTSVLYQKAWSFFYAYIIVFLLMSVSMVAGILLFIIPGIILSVFLCLSPYVLVLEKKRGMEALVKSWYYVKNNWWRVFGRFIVFFALIVCLLIILSLIISITGLDDIGPMTHLDTNSMIQEVSLFESIINQAFQAFIVTPLTISFFYVLYRALRNIKPGEPEQKEQKTIQNNIYGTIIGGGIVMVVLILLTLVFAVKMLPIIFPPEQGPTTNTALTHR